MKRRGRGLKQWSEVSLVEHLVDAAADPMQVNAINLGGPVQGGQEIAVGEVIEDVVDARVALGRQVAFDGLVQQFAAVVQQGAHDAAVKGEVNLVEADRRHGQRVDFLPARQEKKRKKRGAVSLQS